VRPGGTSRGSNYLDCWKTILGPVAAGTVLAAAVRQWPLLRLNDVRVLILTAFDLDEYVYAALRAGASGFLLKDTLQRTC